MRALIPFSSDPKTLKKPQLHPFKVLGGPRAKRKMFGVAKQWDKYGEKAKAILEKISKKDMPAFTDQDRPAKVKEIYLALKRDHPGWPAGKKARIAESTYNKMND